MLKLAWPLLSTSQNAVNHEQIHLYLNPRTLTKLLSCCLDPVPSSHLKKVINIIKFCPSADANKVLVLVLLDLSAASDTVDHKILLNRLENWVGLSKCVLNWLRTYITGRKCHISLRYHVSEKHDITSGVGQGSSLATLLFSLYMFPA